MHDRDVAHEADLGSACHVSGEASDPSTTVTAGAGSLVTSVDPTGSIEFVLSSITSPSSLAFTDSAGNTRTFVVTPATTTVQTTKALRYPNGTSDLRFSVTYCDGHTFSRDVVATRENDGTPPIVIASDPAYIGTRGSVSLTLLPTTVPGDTSTVAKIKLPERISLCDVVINE